MQADAAGPGSPTCLEVLVRARLSRADAPAMSMRQLSSLAVSRFSQVDRASFEPGSGLAWSPDSGWFITRAHRVTGSVQIDSRDSRLGGTRRTTVHPRATRRRRASIRVLMLCLIGAPSMDTHWLVCTFGPEASADDFPRPSLRRFPRDGCCTETERGWPMLRPAHNHISSFVRWIVVVVILFFYFLFLFYFFFSCITFDLFSCFLSFCFLFF